MRRFEMNSVPEEVGEIALVLTEYRQAADALIETYIPRDESITSIVEEHRQIAKTKDVPYDPVAQCLHKALEVAHAPGHVVGKGGLLHPVDYLAAAERIEIENNIPEDSRQTTHEVKLWVLGVSEHTLASTRNGSAQEHIERSAELLSLSRDIEKEKTHLRNLKSTIIYRRDR